MSLLGFPSGDLANAVWIDLLAPTAEESERVAEATGLTIASVVGIPPVLVAGVYGMNFRFMPELNWKWGYPMALVLLVVSAVAPLFWFKKRGWL